ncbi:helix-turn-helix domain-containing protein [Flavivirga spongiicola]|uniref:Helix-turn-helix domain-containing protein n=1 Tax=Flavivirga spongiicola TaxID=421621 RepID=A0ABU7XZD1_9FLAO|nr:helix-turn-helix domain-containing protein [Flavivirga sp. MEBiC05379]MDO5980908.1 helix-turn-helix domain-containing protein [Flavivirga sp. MEBiC05379]
MKVICIEKKAFYKIIDKVIDHVEKRCIAKNEQSKWVSGKEVMKLLNIKSRTTLQKLRDEGKIRFSQPQRRIILYDRYSIDNYLEQHAKEVF